MGDHRELRLAYQPALDGLRAFAVMAVVFYHLDYEWAGGGFLGVDLFFVLSGYLITSLLLREWDGTGAIVLRSFWARRARRLLPAILLLLVGVMLYSIYDESGQQLERVRWDGLATLTYVANWRFVLSGQSYFDLAGPPSPLRHMWSLAIEEQFYILWPLVVFAVVKLSRGSRRVLAGVCLGGIVVSTVLLSVLFEPADPSRAYYGTDSRVHSLLIGCLLAVVLSRWQPRSSGSRAAVHTAGATGALVIVAFWNRMSDVDEFFYRGGSMLYAVAVAAVVVSAIQPAGLLRWGLSFAPLRWVGRISYGLYLWHWPVIVYLSPAKTGLEGRELHILRLAVSFVLATASFLLVEQPIRTGRLRGWAVRVATPAAMGATAVAILVATSGAAVAPASLLVVPPADSADSPWPCEGPGPEETADVTAELDRRGGVQPLPAHPDGALTLLLVGDSWACSLLPGMLEVGRRSGVEVLDASVMGCGVISGEVVPQGGVPAREWSGQCPDIVRARIDPFLQADDPPTALVWSSIWEVTDIYDGDQPVSFGTEESDVLLLSRMEEVLGRATEAGAKLVLLTDVPAPHEYWAGNADQEARRGHLTELYYEFEARHPQDVVVIDLAPRLCPGGIPCPKTVDGIVPRFDGDHYSSAGSAWMAQWLLPQIATALAELATT